MKHATLPTVNFYRCVVFSLLLTGLISVTFPYSAFAQNADKPGFNSDPKTDTNSDGDASADDEQNGSRTPQVQPRKEIEPRKPIQARAPIQPRQ